MTTDERARRSDDGSIRWAVGDLPAERLEAEILTLAQRLSVGTYELLVLVGELDARGTWAAWGALSCAGWLAGACDIEVSTARTQVRVARAMRDHPELDAAMRNGDVSYAKARVLVPHLTDANAAVLVQIAADAPAGALGARLAAWLQGHEDPADTAARHHRERSVTARTDADGMVTVTARLAPEVAGAVLATIDARVTRNRAPAGASLRQQRADALVAAVTDGDGTVTAEIVIHIRDGDGPPTLADGTPLSAHTVAGLVPDAFISLLLRDTKNHPIDASPRRRSPTRRQRRVLDEAHPTCAHPGCGATAFLQYDHIHPYTRGGPTTLPNLCRRCGPHNRARWPGGGPGHGP